MMPQTKATSLRKTRFIIALLILVVAVFAAFFYINATMFITDEEAVSHPNPVVAIIVDLRNLRAAAEIFRNDNLDKLDSIKLELKLLDRYLESPARFTKTPGEYIFAEANGSWWVGYNLSATNKYSDDRKDVYTRLRMMAHGTIYSSMDIKIPYYRGDIVYMRV
jgi:hypothetical protein